MAEDRPPRPDDFEGKAYRAAREKVAVLHLGDQVPTEKQVANLFIEAHLGEVKYAPEQGRWYTQCARASSLWTMDTRNRVGSLIAEHVESLSARYEAKHARTMQRAAFVNAVETLAKLDERSILLVKAMDAGADVIGTPGGIYSLRGATRIDSYDGVLTKSTGYAPAFDEPSRWLQLLDDWIDSAEVRELLWRLAGYSATGSTQEQKACIIHGPAASGKSTFINTIMRVLGDYAMVAPVEMFLIAGVREHPTIKASLRGARLALVHEIPAGARFNESFFKSVVAGDPLSARYMRGDYFSFQPHVTVVFSANHLPSMTSHESMQRRIMVVPFTRQIANTKRKPALQEQILDEAPQILGWVIQGARRWYSEGLHMPAAVKDASYQFFVDADVVGNWIDEAIDGDPNFFESCKELYESWGQWARRTGERIGTMKALSARLKERGYRPGRDHTGCVRGFNGLRVR